MRIRTPRLIPLVAGVLTLSFASSAFAASMFYGDLLTSDKFALLSNRHATASLSLDFDPFAIDTSWDLGAVGTGLGSAKIPPAKKYSHSFGVEGATIEKAWLFVSFSDDGLDVSPETAVVEFDGGMFETQGIFGWMWPYPVPEVVGGEVTGFLVASGDGTLDFTVAPRNPNQDFYIHASLLKVQYSLADAPTDGGSAVPEPGAFLAFATGLLVAAGGLRRRL